MPARRGLMARGHRSPTQKDVAELAGVSVATVSYVTSGRRDRRSPATPEVVARVQAAIEQLNYRPQRAGRVLQQRRTDLVAVAVYTPMNPWALSLVDEIEAVAQSRGLGVIIVRYGQSPQATDRAEMLLTDGIADAAVVLSRPDFGVDRLDRIVAAGVPVLAVGSDTDRDPGAGWDALVQDHEPALIAAFERLVAQGTRRLAVLSDAAEEDQRTQAYRRAAARAGLDLNRVEVVSSPPGESSAVLAISGAARRLLEREADRPDAVMVTSDRGAIATLWIAVELGLRVPDDVRILGAGNAPDGRTVSPPLTTLGCEPAAHRPAVERLLDRVADPSLPAQATVLPWQLIVRGTA